MSATFTTFLMIGVRISEDEFPGALTDDKYLPYYEGHTGVEMSIIQSSQPLNSDDSCPIFAGKVLQKWSEHDQSDGFTRVMPTADFLVVDQFLKECFHIESCSTLIFFTVVN